MKTKLLSISVLALTALLVVLYRHDFFLLIEEPTSEKSEPIINQTASVSNVESNRTWSPKAASTPNNNEANVAIEPESYNPFETLSTDELFEMNDWLSRNGFDAMLPLAGETSNGVIAVEATSYHLYDIDTLKSLADSDQYAELVLGRRLYQARELEEAQTYLERAAANGYGAALQELAQLHLLKASALNREQSEKTISTLIESYAWEHVFNMRFFPTVSEFRRKRPWVRALPEEDILSIEADAIGRAKDIYNNLENIRLEAGLGAFDNSIPDFINSPPH